MITVAITGVKEQNEGNLTGCFPLGKYRSIGKQNMGPNPSAIPEWQVLKYVVGEVSNC